MKKTLLYISAIIITLGFFTSLKPAFATDTLTSAGLMESAEFLEKQTQILKEIWARQEAEIKEAETNNKSPEEIAEIKKRHAEEIAEYQTQYKKEQETLSRDPRSKEFSPSPIPKPSTLPGPTLTTPKQERKIVTTKILPRIASFVIGFAGVLALISILFSGVKLMLSGGEEEVYTSAKARIQWAILGLLVSILAFIAVQITINIDFVENKSPTQNEENN